MFFNIKKSIGVPIVFAFLALPCFLYADTYKVTPRIIDRDVKQRDIFTETITITNSKQHAINVYPSVNEVSVTDTEDIINFTAPSVSDNKTTATSWLSISRARITIASGQSVDIPLNIKIHPEAESGVYHVFVGFGTGSNRPEAEAQVANGEAPGVIITLSVDQEKNEFLKLDQFTIDTFVTDSDNNAVTYTLRNPGSAEVSPTGEIIFSNSRGEEVAAIPVNPDADVLIPGQEVTYSASVPVSGTPGKYKAFLSVDYGTNQRASVYDTEFFYVLPWKKILLIFATLLLFALLFTVLLLHKFGRYEHEHDADEVPMFIRESQSEEKEHDINLKK